MSDYTFSYDQERTHGENFIKWRTLNAEERSAYQEPLLSSEESMELFKKQYGQGDLTVDNPFTQ